MKTVVKSETREVVLSTDGPVIMIGEKINPTGRKRLARALKGMELGYIRQLAVQQADAGADLLDVNVGVPGLDDVTVLPEVVKVVAQVVDLPLCIDTANPEALAAGSAISRRTGADLGRGAD